MYRKLLLAYNGTREGRAALREGAYIAQRCQSQTCLLAVMRAPTPLAMAEGMLLEEYMREEHRHSREILDEGVAKLRALGLEAEGYLAYGDPVEQIVTHAGQLGVDLIVVGHRHRGALARWWHADSVGASLLERAPCSFLVSLVSDLDIPTDSPPAK